MKILTLILLLALFSGLNASAADSRYLLSFKRTIHNCMANVDRVQSANLINSQLNPYKKRLEIFLRGYINFYSLDFEKEFELLQTISMNQSQRNVFIVKSLLIDFETVLKRKLDRGEALSLTGYFSRQLDLIKRSYRTDVLKTKQYKAKNGQTYTLPMFFTEDQSKAHPVMIKIIGQVATIDQIANDIANYASQVNNIQYLPSKRINSNLLGQIYKYELQELVKAFYSPVRNRDGLRETCRKFGFF